MADIEIQAESSLAAVISEIQSKALNVSNILPEIAELLVSAVHDVFEAEGPGWEPLAEVTLQARRKHGKGAKILQDSGLMATSTEKRYGATYAEAVAGVPYAIFHVTGTSRMPKRNPFDLGPYLDGVREDAAEILQSHITEG